MMKVRIKSLEEIRSTLLINEFVLDMNGVYLGHTNGCYFREDMKVLCGQTINVQGIKRDDNTTYFIISGQDTWLVGAWFTEIKE